MKEESKSNNYVTLYYKLCSIFSLVRGWTLKFPVFYCKVEVFILQIKCFNESDHLYLRHNACLCN